jgi:tRNA pseudouridine32 synthase/23S rRNA pseudouridine746 synthase
MRIGFRWSGAYSLILRFGLPSNRAQRTETAAAIQGAPGSKKVQYLMDEQTPVPIVFADRSVVVVDKPGGMPSVPARTPLDPPAVAAVLAAEWGPLEAVHRLDRDTSGLLVLARTAAARAALGRALESRRVAKRYLAIGVGVPPAADGTIHLPLADDPARPPAKRADPILGRRATTRWQVIETIRRGDELRTLVELEPVTGRSHQLRAHLAWLGCPLAGDRLYGRERHASPARLALHAATLEFPHPDDGRVVRLAAPPAGSPWSDFAAPIAAWFTSRSAAAPID